MKIIQTLEAMETGSPMHPIRRIVIIERNNGFYCYAEQYRYRSEYEGDVVSEGWHTIHFDGIYETPRIAEVEGRAAFASSHGVEY